MCTMFNVALYWHKMCEAFCNVQIYPQLPSFTSPSFLNPMCTMYNVHAVQYCTAQYWHKMCEAVFNVHVYPELPSFPSLLNPMCTMYNVLDVQYCTARYCTKCAKRSEMCTYPSAPFLHFPFPPSFPS